MDRITKLVMFIFFLSFSFSCTQDEVIDESPDLLKSAKTKVYPSTATDAGIKAAEDWQSINDALQNADPGETVQLAEGLFYLHKSIIRWDFSGTLKGSGMNKTTIQTAPEKEFDVTECPPLNWSFGVNDGFFMICFAHHYNTEERNVTVSDLKIIVDEPTTPHYRSGQIRNNVQAVHVQYENLDNDLDNPINLNVRYKNLKIIGEYVPGKYLGEGYSLAAGLVGFGASSGNFEAKNVTIENAGTGILSHVFNGENSRVTLKNSTIDYNGNGIFSFMCTGWTILNNKIGHSIISVFLNKYNGRTDIELPVQKTVIKENSFSLLRGAGLLGRMVNDAEVKNNVFYGQGAAGILALEIKNWSIKDNDFCAVENPTEGVTIFAPLAKFIDVRNNYNQSVGGPGINDPSNYIGDGYECN